MHSEPTYLGARMVAPVIEAHFARHRAAAEAQAFPLVAPAPETSIIESIIDAAFWASLRREEGRPPQISLVLLQPEQATQPLIFGHQRRLTPQNLIKLAPAVEQPGIHLGVWHDADGLYVWGTATSAPALCLVLEVVEPGLLVVKHRRADGFGKFINVASLRGDQLKIVDEENAALADYPALRTSLLGMPLPAATSHAVDVLVELAAAMRAHGRGGLLLLVPPASEAWCASIVEPLTYPVVPAYGAIQDLLHLPTAQRRQLEWRQDLLHAIGIVGGFTAVDGATVMTQDYQVLAFGTKVTRRAGSLPVEELTVTEPVIGNEAQTTHPAQNGGTRHLAAAQFVHDQRDSLALVASQDGYFTVFAWSAQRNMVHAHRIDVLLL